MRIVNIMTTKSRPKKTLSRGSDSREERIIKYRNKINGDIMYSSNLYKPKSTGEQTFITVFRDLKYRHPVLADIRYLEK